jgi:serine/threonine-protein kinase
MVGQVVAGRYELEALVGTGGMSSVYRAHDTLLERNVAIKLLHEHVGRDADQVERFKREARAVAQLSHPNIVTVIDRGDRDGRQYIVFEFVEGENLKQHVGRSGPLPVRRALEIGVQIADALAFAHRQGLVHRDVKPQNVLMPAGGDVKVTDFGIARSLDVQGFTQTGSVLGTSHYIAPEQAQGSEVDERTDVYSLGTVLFELLTGDVPYEGDSFVAVALRHVNDPVPSVRELRPEISPRLDAAVRCAMAKEPEDRFRSMDELAGELEACLDELGPDVDQDATMVVPAATIRPRAEPAPGPRAEPPPAAVGQRRRRRVVLPLVLAALAAAIAAGAVAVIHYGVLDNGGGGSGTTTGGGPPPSNLQAVPLRAVGTWDPHGDGTENDGEVGAATDKNPSTYWSTEGYNDGLAAIGKKGVGLVLAAPSESPLASVTIQTDTSGFVAEIQTGPSETGPFETVSNSQTAGKTTTWSLAEGTKARYVVVWITQLARPDKFRAHINEVTAKG